MSTTRYQRFLPKCLGCCLVVLFAACSSISSSGTTAGSDRSPVATTVKPTQVTVIPTTSPIKTVTPRTKLAVTIACNNNKQDGYGLDVAHGKACAQTLPGATLSIQVIYCEGQPDPGKVLQGSVTADAHGFHEWDWTPQPDCKGRPIWGWKVTVTAQLNGQTATEVSQAMA